MNTVNKYSGNAERFSSAFFTKVRDSRFAWRINRGFGKSILTSSELCRKINYKFLLPIRRKCSSLLDGSIIIKKISGAFSGIGALPVRTVGIAYFTFGLLSAALYLLTGAYRGGTVNENEIIKRLICAALAGVCMVSPSSISGFISSSRVLSFAADKFFGYKQDANSRGTVQPSNLLPLFVGSFMSVLSLFTSFFYAAILPVFVVFIYLILSKPYIGISAALILAPFGDAEQIAYLCAFVTAATFIKVLCGKRNIKLSLVGVMLSGVFVSVTVSGFCLGREELKTVLPFIINFVNITSLYRTDRLLERLENAIMFPGIAVAVYRTVYYVISCIAGYFGSEYLIPVLAANTTASVFAVISAIPVTVSVASRKNDKDRKTVFFFALVLMILSLYGISGETALILGISACLLMLVLSYKKALAPVMAIVPVAAVVFAFAPLENGESIALISVDRLIKALPLGVILSGGGIGQSNAYALYSTVTGMNTPTEIDAYSSVMLTVGVIGMAFILGAICVTLINSLKTVVCRKNTVGRRLSVCAGTVSSIFIIITGLFFDIGTDPACIAMAVTVLAYTAAAQRLAEKYGINENESVYGGYDD